MKKPFLRHTAIAAALLTAGTSAAALPLPGWLVKPVDDQSSDDLYLGCINTVTDPANPATGRPVPIRPAEKAVVACTRLLATIAAGTHHFSTALQGDLVNPSASRSPAQQALADTRLAYIKSVILWRRGNAYAEMRDPARAIADYDEAIRLSPGYGVPYQYRADLYAQQGDFVRALADYDAVLRMRPLDWRARNGRGMIRLRRGDFAGGLADFEAALTRAQTLPAGSVQAVPARPVADAPALYGRGLALLGLGRKTEAEADLWRAFSLDQRVAATYADFGLRP